MPQDIDSHDQAGSTTLKIAVAYTLQGLSKLLHKRSTELEFVPVKAMMERAWPRYGYLVENSNHTVYGQFIQLLSAELSKIGTYPKLRLVERDDEIGIKFYNKNIPSEQEFVSNLPLAIEPQINYTPLINNLCRNLVPDGFNLLEEMNRWEKNQELAEPSKALPESYRYGLYLDPKPNDPSVSELMDAAEKAEALAKEYGPSTPIAVWDNRDNTVYLYLNNERFQRF